MRLAVIQTSVKDHQPTLVWKVHMDLNDNKRLEELEIRGIIQTIQTTALLKSAGIFRRVLEIW